MSKININDVYLSRIEQIDIDIKKNISKKNWVIVNLLKKEKEKISKCINK